MATIRSRHTCIPIIFTSWGKGGGVHGDGKGGGGGGGGGGGRACKMQIRI